MTGALDGIRIADFSWVGAGPRATKDLADNGATVVKIESRRRLDLGRMSPPFKDGRRDVDGSAFFAQTNTGKYSVAINLADPRGAAVCRRLIAWCDVVVENFSKGFLDRIGLSYADMVAIRPDVILVSVSVAGRTGPLADMRGYGNSAAALSGQAALAGWPDQPPHMPPFAYGDVVAPMFATLGVLGALHHRRRTGQGQHVDVSQVEPLIHTLSDAYASHQAGTPDAAQRGNRVAHAAPHGVFACSGTDQWCAIAVETQAHWQALCQAMDQPGLATDPRFATLPARKTNEDALETLVGAWTAPQDKHRLAAALRQSGIPAGAVQDGREVFTDADLRAGGHYVALTHPVLGANEMPAPPMRFSRAAIDVRRAPLLGEHTATVLQDWLGMPPDEVAGLVQAGVLA